MGGSNQPEYQTAFFKAANAMALADIAGDLLYCNPAAFSILFEDSVDEFGPIRLSTVFKADDYELFHPGKSLVLKPLMNELQIEIDVHEAQNEMLLLMIESSDAKGKFFHTQRLETLGMLAGGIAHDFNNVLTGLLGHITYLKNVLPEAGSHSESLLAIEEGSKKASTLTQQILNFSKLKTVEESSAVDLVNLLQRTCSLLKGAFPPSCKLELILPQDAVYINGVEGKIAQVIVNLVMNSKAAIGNNGTIQIALDVDTVKSADLSKEEALARVRVIDDGEGIAQSVLERIFEPYFSTKTHGTGLGLATVQKIIDEAGGAISIESRLGKGTEVTVVLPLLLDSQTEKTGEAASALPRGSERILIVDDEGPVRNVLALSLKHLGYSVEIATSGQEALDIFKDNNGSFDLVILDMLMPNLSGDETFFRLKELDDNVKVLVISGYSSEEAVQRIIENGGRGFIQKPFTIDQLATVVRDGLG